MFNQSKFAVICLLVSIGLYEAFVDNAYGSGVSGVLTKISTKRGPKSTTATVDVAIEPGTVKTGATVYQPWYEKLAEERRKAAEQFINDKYAKVSALVGKATRTMELCKGVGVYIQHYERGFIMYHERVGLAFEMHGPIWDMYKQDYATAERRAELGYLLSDVDPIGNGGFRSIFSRGAVLWSPRTPAIPVLGQIFLDYEDIGGPDSLGFPMKKAVGIRTGNFIEGFFDSIFNRVDGYKQEFENAHMYHDKSKPTANEVHGAILTKYIETGGVGKWGFPITNEMDVMGRTRLDVRSRVEVIGRVSKFEKCAIYWNKSTSQAHLVEREFLLKYDQLNGPSGNLGFPTSDTQKVTGSSVKKTQSFNNQSLVLLSSGTVFHARPFWIKICDLVTEESEGPTKGENDLYIEYDLRVRSKTEQEQTFLGKVGKTLRHKEGRLPSEGDWGDKNTKYGINYDIPLQLYPNIDEIVELRIRVYDADGPADGDDHLGTVRATFDASNVWQLRQCLHGPIKLADDKVKSLMVSSYVKVDPKSLSEAEKWWGSKALNRPTDDISWENYSMAFRDVKDEPPDVEDIITLQYKDWLRWMFYKLVVKDLAERGNCFGMTLEGIRARRQESKFVLPISQLEWKSVEKDFNINHCYQVSAPAVWWFLEQFITGNTHDPKDVYKHTDELCDLGLPPILCVTQDYWFRVKPHSLLPVKCAMTRGGKWDITVCDPYYTGTDVKHIIISPSANTFEYKGKSDYEGGDLSGGRLFYIPYQLVAFQSKTPVDDLWTIIKSGTMILLGGDATTESITDGTGKDLNAFGPLATNMLKQGKRLDGFFLNMKGFGNNAIAGEFLIRNEPRDMDRDFIHQFKGGLEYAVKNGLSEFRITGESKPDDVHTCEVQDLGTISSRLILKADRNKPAKLELTNKLGVGQDRICIMVDSLLAGPEQTLELSIRPGLGDLEILNPRSDRKGNLYQADGTPATVKELKDIMSKPVIPVRISAIIDGRKIDREWKIPLEDGLRINFTSALYKKELTYSRIDRIFGPAISTQQAQ